MWHVPMGTDRTPGTGRLTALAHRAGVEVPHLVIALTTVAVGIATLVAL